MKVNIFDKRIPRIEFGSDVYYFNQDDLHPSVAFFLQNRNVKPETAEEVRIKGLLEHIEHVRHILKIADSLLAVNGIMQIEFVNFSFDTNSSPYRNWTLIMYEISICFKERLRLISKELINGIYILKFFKLEQFLPVGDSMKCWSFGIVSGGHKNADVLGLINQIQRFGIPQFEVLICGPSPCHSLGQNVRVLDDRDLYFDSRVPISKKKNRIIEEARYNNLVILHDRFVFCDDWYDKMSAFGNYFDGVSPRILDFETHSIRIQDWMTTSLNHFEFKKLFSKKSKLEYNEWKPNWNLNGGHMIIKKHLISRVMLNPYLNWGEAEDGDLCRRLDADGFCLICYPDLTIYTRIERFNIGLRQKGIKVFITLFKQFVAKILGHMDRKLKFWKYLKNAN